MLETIKNCFKIKDIRKRLLYTFGALLIIRLGCSLPAPAINHEYFTAWLEAQQGSLGFLNMLTGGSFEQMSIFALNISPYITASIIMQLLTIAIPRLEEMQKEGEEGKKKIAAISRVMTVGLALIQSVAMAIGFGRTQVTLADGTTDYVLSGGLTFTNVLLVAFSFTAGSAFLMWLGERITEYGVGNGISIILLVNIVAGLPTDFANLFQSFVFNTDTSVPKGVLNTVIILAIVVGLVALIILLQDAQRKIAVQYSRQASTHKIGAGTASYIPIKVNTAGVIPVIFASSLMQFPIILLSFFKVYGDAEGSVGEKILYGLNSGNWFDRDEGMFIFTLGVLVYIALIVFFAYFYTSITFNPYEISNNLRKQSGSIPGIRPGKPTMDYLVKVLNYIIFIGAIGLTLVAIIPVAFGGWFNASIGFGGTSIIIVVGVILETMKQIESQMLVRHYKGFLTN